MKQIIFAHRGASGYCPENTSSAFEKSIELGATGIETDVQLTKDNHPVLIHDETLRRTTSGNGRVEHFTLSELKKLDAGSWFHSRFKGETIPTLDEFFQLMTNNRVLLNLELKNDVVLYPELEERVIHAVKRVGFTHRVIISSFNHNSLMKCKKIAPEVYTGLLYNKRIPNLLEYAQSIGVHSLHPKKSLVSEKLIKLAQTGGLKVYPWTVNRIAEMNRILWLRADGLITDYPDRLKIRA